MKKILMSAILLISLSDSVYPCFDTYLFLRRGSMVYPRNMLIVDLNNEYSFNRIGSPQNDVFMLNGNLYYGVTDEFSVQFSLGSGEKPRDDFGIDSYGIRGVYNLFSSMAGGYTLDFIAEGNGSLDGTENGMTVSIPNIFRSGELTYVLHPATRFEFGRNNISAGGHTGIFYDFNGAGIIGAGAEYMSVHGSSSAVNRMTRSELSASLFLGAKIGGSLYIQNEIAKGVSNSRDFGFALTTKVIL